LETMEMGPNAYVSWHGSLRRVPESARMRQLPRHCCPGEACAAFQLGCCSDAFDDLDQAPNSPRGFHDRVFIAFTSQDKGLQDLGIARAVSCLDRIINT
jgi:hypothetical protein